MNLGDIAKKINGTVIGDASLEITDVRSIETAEEGHITFITEKNFLDKLKQSKASAVLVDSEQAVDMNQVITPGPMLAFARLLDYFHPQSRPNPGIHPTVVLGANVVLGKRVTLSPLVCIGNNVQIGDDVVVWDPSRAGTLCGFDVVRTREELLARAATCGAQRLVRVEPTQVFLDVKRVRRALRAWDVSRCEYFTQWEHCRLPVGIGVQGVTVAAFASLQSESIADALAGGREDDIVLLPGEALNGDRLFIDTVSFEEVRARLAPARVVPGHELTAMLRAL